MDSVDRLLHEAIEAGHGHELVRTYKQRLAEIEVRCKATLSALEAWERDEKNAPISTWQDNHPGLDFVCRCLDGAEFDLVLAKASIHEAHEAARKAAGNSTPERAGW